MRVPGFVGPSNLLRTVNEDADETINLYPTKTAPGTAKAPLVLVGTPGLRPWLTLPTSPLRGMFEMNGRAWAVSGGAYYELFDDATYGTGQPLANDGSPVSIVSNGSAGFQNFICSANLGYIADYTTNLLTLITAPGFPEFARIGEFMDGYFFALHGHGSRAFSWSALEDGLSWDALDIAERSEAADNLTTIVRNHRELWLPGGGTSEVWVDQGDALNPFAPLQGVFLEVGCTSPWSMVRIQNTVMWMGRSQAGAPGVWMADGFKPVKVSTDAVDIWLGRQTALTATIAWTYRQDGHVFYVLIPLFADVSYVYDVTEGLWHKRAHWNPLTATWSPYRPGCCIDFADKVLVGDRLTGTIYEMGGDIYDEELTSP